MARMAILSMFSGFLLCGAHGYWPWLGAFATVPLWIALMGLNDATLWHAKQRLRAALYLGLVCGLIEAGILWGLALADLWMWIGIALWYGLVRALYCVVLCAIAPPSHHRIAWCGVAPSLWALVEWGHAQIPYTLPNLLGDTQHTGWLLPLAAVAGTYGISWLLVAFGTLGAVAVPFGAKKGGKSGSLNGRLGWLAGALAGVGAMALWWSGAWLGQQAGTAEPIGGPVRVAAVQGGLGSDGYGGVRQSHALIWFPWDVYTGLTTVAPPADLTLWPETSVGQVWFGGAFGFHFLSSASTPSSSAFSAIDTTRIDALKHMLATRGPLLMGALRRDDDGALYNSALLFTADRTAPWIVDKQRVALRAESYLTPGSALSLMPALHRDDPFGVIFCLESVVPQHTRALVQGGATWLAVLADGSRFENSAVGRLHAQRSIVRAVEVGRDVVHVGQSGETMVISAHGFHTLPLPPYQRDVVVGDVQPRTGNTWWVRWGDGWIMAMACVVVLALLHRCVHASVRWRRARRKPR